jgi:hypothetical protein
MFELFHRLAYVENTHFVLWFGCLQQAKTLMESILLEAVRVAGSQTPS